MERLETQAIMWPKALAGVGAVYGLLRLEARKGGRETGANAPSTKPPVEVVYRLN
jgi:hypothetical protein